jgi:hypothetical protein
MGKDLLAGDGGRGKESPRKGAQGRLNIVTMETFP